MCLIVFGYDCHPGYQLVLGANRDEYRNRPTDQARFWPDAPHILAGRDLRAGGTWLGVSSDGKIAAITNYRDPHLQVNDPPSRGALVANYLANRTLSTKEFQSILNHDGHLYDGFNLLYGTSDELHYFTNRGGSSGPVTPGIHGLSNHLLDTGIGPERERLLSPIFIANEGYGTRSTTILIIDRSGHVTFIERTFDRTSVAPLTQRFSFRIQSLIR